MLNKLPDDLLFIIFSKLPNYEIINLLATASNLRKIIKTNFFITYLLKRHHPLVFNTNNRYCCICNFNLYIRLNDKNRNIIRCQHY